MARVEISAVAELFKPITWFPPMWAFACGAVASGYAIQENWFALIAGIMLAGPLLCATSQAVNDWFDRDVDAINQPNRPIPSGRIPGKLGLHIALVWTCLSALFSWFMGIWVFLAALIGLMLAWAYSAPPFRLKQNGWLGNTACAASYEGLAWVTGAAVMAQGATPHFSSLVLAMLYSIGAHGIMTLNDFKSIEGDRRMGIASLPVQLGIENAARTACVFMLLPQCVVALILISWQQNTHASAITLLTLIQAILMRKFLNDPRKFAAWYSAYGVTLYVIGMLVSAFALRASGSAL
jgi:chlorophyll/bacteriochlorophyll a synthase